MLFGIIAVRSDDRSFILSTDSSNSRILAIVRSSRICCSPRTARSPTITVHHPTLTNFKSLQLAIINKNLYALSMSASKLSIISFFHHAFPSRNFRRCLLAISGFTLLWLLSTIAITNVQCWRLKHTWKDSTKETDHLNFDLFAVLTTGLNTAGSLALAGITVPMVLRLRLSKRKKRLIYVAYAISLA